MTLNMKKMVLLAKEQSALGNDAAPTGAANAILCRALAPEPIVADAVDRNLLRGYKGRSGSLMTGVHRQFTFEVELAGAGSAGTAPAWGALLKSCGFAETINAGTSVVYAPTSGGDPYLTLYGYLDGIRFKLLDALGSVSFELNAKSIPVAKYKFLGAYSAITDADLPTGVDYSDFVQPLTVGRVNTPTLTLHGISAVASAASLDVANTLAWSELIGSNGAISNDRAPSGSITMQHTLVATKNWAEAIRTGTTGALELVHGVTAGNIIEIDAPAAQLKPYTISDDNGMAMMQLPFDLLPVAGNDELVITVR